MSWGKKHLRLSPPKNILLFLHLLIWQHLFITLNPLISTHCGTCTLGLGFPWFRKSYSRDTQTEVFTRSLKVQKSKALEGRRTKRLLDTAFLQGSRAICTHNVGHTKSKGKVATWNNSAKMNTAVTGDTLQIRAMNIWSNPCYVFKMQEELCDTVNISQLTCYPM